MKNHHARLGKRPRSQGTSERGEPRGGGPPTTTTATRRRRHSCQAHRIKRGAREAWRGPRFRCTAARRRCSLYMRAVLRAVRPVRARTFFFSSSSIRRGSRGKRNFPSVVVLDRRRRVLPWEFGEFSSLALRKAWDKYKSDWLKFVVCRKSGKYVNWKCMQFDVHGETVRDARRVIRVALIGVRFRNSLVRVWIFIMRGIMYVCFLVNFQWDREIVYNCPVK